MKLYDSLSQKLKPLPQNKALNIYLCGPTVYDDIHIGNIAPVIIFDFLIRYLQEKNINFQYIHNITDIDDKIVNKAQLLQISEEEVAGKYEKKYLKLLNTIGIIFPHHTPRVSDHIKEIQEVIKILVDKGYAELNGEDVVFKLELIKEYGELSKQKLQELKNISDFCLWKKITTGKTWDSPWGKGRPGWHTECFAFINKYCKGTVDIHGGGIDLKFPHHENENAHCRAIHGKGLADIWIHIGHLNTSAGKISKSNNSKYLVKDVLNNYSPNTLRLLFLSNSYKNPSLITDEKFQEVKKEWKLFLSSINKAISAVYLQETSTQLSEINQTDPEFLAILEKDLNLPEVLTWLQKIRKELFLSIKNLDLTKIKHTGGKLKWHLEWLGFKIPFAHTNEKLQLLQQWNEFKRENNWEKADEIRNILLQEEII